MTGRPLRFVDLALYAVAMTLSIRWIAAAAAAGPMSILLWVLAMVGFMGPLVIATAELTSRFPGEGGLYGWTGQALGPFAGFVTGWLYWTCNLPYLSGLLYFIVNVLAVAGGPTVQNAVKEPAVFAAFAVALAVLVAALHFMGLGIGKWLGNVGAAASIGLLAILIAAGAALALSRGSATNFTTTSYALPLNADGAALWATMVFAFGGPEALAFLRGDVRGGMPQILKVLAVVAVILAGAYVLGTLAMLAIMAPGEASRLSGVPDAVELSLSRLGLGALAPGALILLALSLLGGYSAWFGVAARLPFVIGVDRYLPAAFARRSPRTGAPTTAILVQTLAVIILVALSQAGASVKAAYDFLVSMSVLSYTVPFVFLFIAYLILQGRAAPADAWAPRGGPRVARRIGAVGLVVTLSAIACTMVPSPDATDKVGAVVKLLVASTVLIAAGVAIYAYERRRAAVAAVV
jgi:glutamate:GABA antiporter